jgi:hypothetical protein
LKRLRGIYSCLLAPARMFMENNALTLRTKIERSKVEVALKGKASEYKNLPAIRAGHSGGLP